MRLLETDPRHKKDGELWPLLSIERGGEAVLVEVIIIGKSKV